MLYDMPDYEWYTFLALIFFFVIVGMIEGKGNLKLVFLICTITSLFASADVSAGDRKYNSRGAGQSKTSSIMEQQKYMNWLQQGCPSFIAPRYNIQSEPRQQQSERPLPTWGREGVSGTTKGRR